MATEAMSPSAGAGPGPGLQQTEENSPSFERSRSTKASTGKPGRPQLTVGPMGFSTIFSGSAWASDASAGGGFTFQQNAGRPLTAPGSGDLATHRQRPVGFHPEKRSVSPVPGGAGAPGSTEPALERHRSVSPGVEKFLSWASSSGHHLAEVLPSNAVKEVAASASESVSPLTEEEQVLSVSFNQDNSCFACATTLGFRVFSCSHAPVRQSLCRAEEPWAAGGSPREGALPPQTQPPSSLTQAPHNARPDPPSSGSGGAEAAGVGQGTAATPQEHGCMQSQAHLSSTGSVQTVEMLYRSNLLALVGGGLNPRFPATKVVIWDDGEGRCVGELVFRGEVRGVRLRREHLVVVLDHTVYVYSLANLMLIAHIDTVPHPHLGPRPIGASIAGPSPPLSTAPAGAAQSPSVAAASTLSASSWGLCAVSQSPHSFVLACLGLQKGQVRVEHFDLHMTRLIWAHESGISALALTADGTRLATASVRGTLARIFCTSEGTMLQEVRRGADRADIYSMAFSAQGSFLALTSDKGTAHVFSVSSPGGSQAQSGRLRSESPHSGGRPHIVQGAVSSTTARAGARTRAAAVASLTPLPCAVQAARTSGAGAWRLHEPWPPSPVHPSARLGVPEALGGTHGLGMHIPGAEGVMLHQRRHHQSHQHQSHGHYQHSHTYQHHHHHHHHYHHHQQQQQPHQQGSHGQTNPARGFWDHQHGQRLRQSQSCPPRRWISDRPTTSWSGLSRPGFAGTALHDGLAHSYVVPLPSSSSTGRVPSQGESEAAAHTGAADLPKDVETPGLHHASNPVSSLSFMRAVFPRYFGSEWSLAQFRHLPTTSRSVVAFGPEKHSLLVATHTGRFFRLRFDPVHGGEMTLEEEVDVLHLPSPAPDVSVSPCTECAAQPVQLSVEPTQAT